MGCFLNVRRIIVNKQYRPLSMDVCSVTVDNRQLQSQSRCQSEDEWIKNTHTQFCHFLENEWNEELEIILVKEMC